MQRDVLRMYMYACLVRRENNAEFIPTTSPGGHELKNKLLMNSLFCPLYFFPLTPTFPLWMEIQDKFPPAWSLFPGKFLRKVDPVLHLLEIRGWIQLET